MKNNLMVRLMTGLILVGIVLAHFAGHTDLLSVNWLWLAVLPAVMGFQATFTGFCPAALVGKLSKTGECCPGGSCATQKPAATTPATTAQTTASCCGSDNTQTASSCCSGNANLQIKVLGTGCANCTNTVKLIQATADELNIAIDLIKVEDIAQIAAYGVMSTPGVVINDQVVHTGGIPTKHAIREWLNA